MAITLLAKHNSVNKFAERAPRRQAPTAPGQESTDTLMLPPELIEPFDAAAARHERSRASMLTTVMS